jgi:nucleoside-diphosphate-sugar epimerase
MKVLITGATGMVGRSVLLECLEDNSVEKVYLLSRRPIEIKHTKIQGILVADFEQLTKNHFTDLEVDACFHCMGISSVGQSEATFSKVTYDATKVLMDVMYEVNPGMVVTYVSGVGTDTSEKGKVMWARVKGKTENYILNRGFAKSYMFRPGMILPEKGIKSRTFLYQFFYVILRPFFPLFRLSKNVTTTTKLGKSMIRLVSIDNPSVYIENRDINEIVI